MNHTTYLIKLVTITILLCGLSIPQAAHAAPTSFDWGSFSATGLTTYGVYDTDGMTVLQTGDLVQLIWTGPDGAVDPPQSDGAPGDDDQVLQTSTINNGLPLPPPQQNKGYAPLTTYTFDTDDPHAGGTVYIRAWNNNTPQTATAYGDSGTTTLQGGTQWSAPRWNTGEGPTAVTLAFFVAVPGEHEIVVSWETASEVDILGFNLYRSDSGHQRICLNAGIIPGQAPGSAAGAVYEFRDGSVSANTTYEYWLDVVDIEGAVTVYGPVTAGLPGSYRFYLPVVLLNG